MADTNILDILAALSPVLGKAAGANQGQNNFEDITKQAAWNNLEQNSLARDKFAAAAPGQRLATGNMASMTKNFTPTKVSFAGKGAGRTGQPFTSFSGGAAGAARDPRSSQIADSVLEQELMAQMKGAAGGDSKMTPQPAIAQESLGAKLLGAGATGTSLLGALSKLAGGSGSGGGGDLGKLLDLFKGHGGAESEANSPQHQEEDTRGQANPYDGNYQDDPMISGSGGTAYGPDGQPLEKGYGTDWWQEGNGYDPSQDPTANLYNTDDLYNTVGPDPGPLWGG